MKIGIRTPSIKKSIKARTTGKVKRKLKRVVNPLYGKKGMGFIKNPVKSVKGKIYRKTTISAKSLTNSIGSLVWLFIMIPLYVMWYILLLTWYLFKFMVVGLVWVTIMLINGCIALIEWWINKNSQIETDTMELPEASSNQLDSIS